MSKKKLSWADLKGRLKTMPAAALLGVIQDIYGLTKENKAFLEARFFPDAGAGIEEFRRRVTRPFLGDGDLKFGDARKAIRDYEAATSDLGGTLDLMLIFVEKGNWFTRVYGDINGAFYDALLSMLDQFAKRLMSEDGREFYVRFGERLRVLYERSRDIGWGYSDEMEGILEEVREAFEKQ